MIGSVFKQWSQFDFTLHKFLLNVYVKHYVCFLYVVCSTIWASCMYNRSVVGATMFNNVGSCCVRLHAALKTEFALLQTLSRLFHLVYFVKCWQMLLKLNSKGLYQSSGKERERWFFSGKTTLVWAFTAFNKDVQKIHQSRTSYKHKNLMRSVIYWHWSGHSNVV